MQSCRRFQVQCLWFGWNLYDKSTRIKKSLSEQFDMHRGCRQGGPVSPYLFLLYAEILAIFIYQNTDIKGIVVNEHKISWICRRYISYHWWFCGLSLYCPWYIRIVCNVFWFEINSTKTKVTYIGWKKKFAEVFHQSRWKLDWRETTFFLLRIHFL